MTNEALQIPEGFVSKRPTSGLVFQNPSNWLKAGQEEGTMVVGIYEGLTEKDAYGKQNFIFSATRVGVAFTKDGDEKLFPIGSKVIINTSANIASKLTDADIGAELCVVYQGQHKLTKGPYAGKKAHLFDVGTVNK